MEECEIKRTQGAFNIILYILRYIIGLRVSGKKIQENTNLISEAYFELLRNRLLI